MSVTITNWAAIGNGIITIGIIVLLVMAILLLKKIIDSLKKFDQILEDTDVITNIASKRAVEVDEMIDSTKDRVATVTESLKASSSVFKVLASIVSLVRTFTERGNKNEDKEV
ncbi:MAG: hypothetical protein ACRCUS_05715 [Anaerovoracaceae bacterium]